MKIEKYGRFWAVYDEKDILVCVTVYKKGAIEVKRRLGAEVSNNNDMPEGKE